MTGFAQQLHSEHVGGMVLVFRTETRLAQILGVPVLGVAIAAVAACGGSSENAAKTTSNQATTTPVKAARVPADPSGFLEAEKKMATINTKPFDRANEICDMLDRGYTYEQVRDAELVELSRNWRDVNELRWTYVDAGFLTTHSIKFVCPEHLAKLSH